MITKKFHKFVRINETVRIEDPQILLKNCETYLDNTYSLSNDWKNIFFKKLEENSHYTTLAYSLDDLIQKVETERNNIEGMLDNIQLFINRWDKIYSKVGELTESENKIYDELDEVSSKLDKIYEEMEEYRDEVKSVRKKHLELDEAFVYLRRFKFNNKYI
jgi:uncharacterized coiled-coil DUF342 family protein